MKLAKFLMGKKDKKPTKSLLSSKDLKGVAEFIQSNKCSKIAILAGAGISVSAGIPDFRSSDGFYNTLNVKDFPMLTNEQIQRLQSDPEWIFSISLFTKNPSVYIHARKPFILANDKSNKYTPTLTHWFFRLLEDKKLLKRFYSTNIDSLDLATNISSDKLIHVHGTTGNAICYACKQDYDMNKLRDLLKKDVQLKQYITCDKCKKRFNYIKPDTVLFGESLPDIYFDLLTGEKDLKDVDLLIVAGTSLSVSPSNSLPEHVDKTRCVRLYVNREDCGLFDFKSSTSSDVFYKGNCDDGFKELATLLGWTNDLTKLINDNKMLNNNNNDNNDVKMNNADNSNDNILNNDNNVYDNIDVQQSPNDINQTNPMNKANGNMNIDPK